MTKSMKKRDSNTGKWEYRDLDRDMFQRELNDFVPDKIYDAHAHLYRTIFWHSDPDAPYYAFTSPPDVTLEVYREHMAWIFPEREIHGLHSPMALVQDTQPGNEWVAREIVKDPLARGQLLVKADDDPEWVRQEVKRLGFRGLTPFATYAHVPNPMEAEIPDYLPEPIMAVADQEGWSITLHMMRARCAADASNQHWIRHYCQRYPNMQLILDHCARGFNPYLVLEGLPKLTGLNNLWIDTSYICQPLAVEAVLRIIGPERTLYGSDFCLSHERGLNFGVADTFTGVVEGTLRGMDGRSPVCMLLAGLENLRAIKAACWSAGLKDHQIEQLFWGNATRLMGVQ